ncbi:hypothetical protein D3C81_2049190 [compost metagenome]
MAALTTQLNHAKVDFMLQFILNARLSGRSQDIGSGGERCRRELVEAAEDLYNQTMKKCEEPISQEK